MTISKIIYIYFLTNKKAISYSGSLVLSNWWCWGRLSTKDRLYLILFRLAQPYCSNRTIHRVLHCETPTFSIPMRKNKHCTNTKYNSKIPDQILKVIICEREPKMRNIVWFLLTRVVRFVATVYIYLITLIKFIRGIKQLSREVKPRTYLQFSNY